MTPQDHLEQLLIAKGTSADAFVAALTRVRNIEPERFTAFLHHLIASVLKANRERDALWETIRALFNARKLLGSLDDPNFMDREQRQHMMQCLEELRRLHDRVAVLNTIIHELARLSDESLPEAFHDLITMQTTDDEQWTTKIALMQELFNQLD